MLLLESAHDYDGNIFTPTCTRQRFADLVAYQESLTMKVEMRLRKTAHKTAH